MSKKLFLSSFNPVTEASKSIPVPAGQYTAFLLRFTGTTVVGQTLTLNDLGNVRLERRGDQKQLATWRFWNNWDNLKGGFIETVSGNAATAENVSILIPLNFPGSYNAMYLQGDKELFIKTASGGSLGTRMGANVASVEVYGIIEDTIPESYELIVEPGNITPAGAVTLPQSITKNVAAEYIDDTGGILDRLSVMADDNTIIDNVALAVLNVFTNIENKVENSANPLTEVNFATSGNLTNAVNEVVKNTYTFNAAGTLVNTIFRINEKSPAKAESLAHSRAFANAKSKLVSPPGVAIGRVA